MHHTFFYTLNVTSFTIKIPSDYLLNLMGINRSPKQGLSRLILIDFRITGRLHL